MDKKLYEGFTNDPESIEIDFIDQAKQFAMTDIGLTDDEADRAIDDFLEANNI